MGKMVRQSAPPPDEVDARTVFVRDLNYSLTDAQLEEVFSEVGPVRHCFTVKQKDTEQNRGFGFVQFANAEDASRAVETKNGMSLQGRKMKVELAKRRAPLEQRHPRKPKDGQSLEGEPQSIPLQPVVVPQGSNPQKKRKASDVLELGSSDTKAVPDVKKKKAENSLQGSAMPLSKGKRPREEGKSSEKQKSARTVVIGGLINPEMKEAVISVARKVDESTKGLHTSLTEQELSSHGLLKDGCKPGAISIVFSSVRGARQAVASLHRMEIGGAVVWARQLGGEGARSKKWRLIVRNLPFSVTEAALRELFAPAGFVWEMTIPLKPDGKPRGFAFVTFTCKADAEKAISTVNMKTVEKRPIAVDWAVSKKEYQTISGAADPPQSGEEETVESEDTASEIDDEYEDEVPAEPDVKKKRKKLDKKSKKIQSSVEAAGDETVIKADLDPSDEVDMIRKVMNKIVASSTGIGVPADPNDTMEHVGDDTASRELFGKESDQEKSNHIAKASSVNLDDALSRTVFVRNLPLDVKVVDMKKKFSVHGEVQAFRLVYDKRTKKPKGTAFLEFTTVEAANACMAGSMGADSSGIKVGGHTLVLSSALDRNAAKSMPKDAEATSVDDSIDRTVFIRNLPTNVKVSQMRETFSVFGEVKSLRLVLHHITKKPKGTAFLEFGSVKAANAAVAATKGSKEQMEKMPGILLGGRSLIVDMAVGQQAARDISVKLSKKESEDPRNLHLAKEGAILEGTPAAQGLSKADLRKRNELRREKETKLRSPNFHVSRTRLAVHNVPKTNTEKDLKKLFIDAVLSRASKQKPVIKQVKILKDFTKSGDSKSRGTAFVEFTEHQHALVAIRVLNNNPDVFGHEHRPIVEFAIENVKILQKRAERAIFTKNRPEIGEGKKTEQKGRQGGKRKRETLTAASPEVEVPHVDGAVIRGDKRERKVRKKQPDASVSSAPADVTALKVKKGRARKHAPESPNTEKVEPQKVVGLARSKPLLEQRKARGNQHRMASQKQAKVLKQAKLPKQTSRREKKEKNGGEDRLEKLITEYRSKYFSNGQGPEKAQGKSVKLAEDLRRWFD